VNYSWIHFNFFVGLDAQIALHKMFRSKISYWKNQNLAKNSVLTYHFRYPNRGVNDSLYLCLELPSVHLPPMRSNLVSEKVLKQIPLDIRNSIRQAKLEYLTNPMMDKLEVIDYEFDMICKSASNQYNGAPIEEILNFASKGTEVALEILGSSKTFNETWETDSEIANSLNEMIQQRLTSDREQNMGLHFSCNSAFIVRSIEIILRRILNREIDGRGRGVLEFFYEMERSGNLEVAWQHFLQIYRRYF